MFCPECGYEYREGFTECADCGVALVIEPPPDDAEEIPAVPAGESDADQPAFVVVHATYSQSELIFLKSILDSTDITFHFSTEHINQGVALSEPVRLMVAREDVEQALELLKDHDVTVFGLSSETYSSGDDE